MIDVVDDDKPASRRLQGKNLWSK